MNTMKNYFGGDKVIDSKKLLVECDAGYEPVDNEHRRKLQNV